MAAADSLDRKRVTRVTSPPAGSHDGIERQLQHSAWNAGAAEAHGMLCALACRGVRAEDVHAKAWLLRLSAEQELELLGAMMEKILSELQSDGFCFALLLPDAQSGWARRVESISAWCAGFVQGFFHDDAGAEEFPHAVREPLEDIMKICRIDIGAPSKARGGERKLVEIEEHLRVGVQLIFDELNPPREAKQNARAAV